MDGLKLGGLKVSFALCKFDLRGQAPPQNVLSNISKALAAKKINIEFLTYNTTKTGAYHISLCVNQNEFYTTSNIFQIHDLLPLSWEVIPRKGIGMLTLFPYDSALAILAVIVVSWGNNSIPIHGVATSLSAVSFLTDFQTIDKAVAVTQTSFQLPGDHAPLKPELHYYQSNARKKD
jgi:aspartokinase